MNNRIKEVRESQKLSQSKFGEKIGVSRDTVANIEAGRIEIKEIFIKSICKEFEINEDWLKTGQGEMKKILSRTQEIGAFANDVMGEMDESFKKRFILALSKLNERDWETLEKIADVLKEK